MRSFVLLSFLGGLALVSAQTKPKCESQCPLVKCPATDAATLCRCKNTRERLCKEMCPDYQPLYLPCPISPPTNSPIPPPCENKACPMVWPQSCYCMNSIKSACFAKCGGEAPTLQECPPLSQPSFVTLAALAVVDSTKPTPKPQPTGANPVCGGGRGNYRTCEEGWTCIKNPYKPGCGPECDGLGVCVKDRMCGGFAGFACGTKGQVCVDDPRDDCDPKRGGADCGGLCMWEEKVQEE
ncbi:hypothetical protein BU24DRAFT_384656 [Aaosphaeria arxii CBS 175.79]|uniref:Uncharacterized protein n=1 Tax=Aaosphaeria arxii CBS 175.79 TaxID=1450172 RepID=A0A6A5YAA4_9PLEO|nr:uncharacterized protein BU24DRAFT_384656 [Aaosphaeria arxii CBS 175.79]KAF2022156.1 hypothetical protein BU24DRAFT_384656 [Aaosphaeria arxii CBS 175.79]